MKKICLLSLMVLLVVGFLTTTTFVCAQEPQNLQSASWMWAKKDMSVNYSFGQENKAVAKVILKENNFGYQMTKENCHFYIPFAYQLKGDSLYASLPNRNEAQVSQISFTPDGIQAQEVRYYVKTYSAISGEHKENILETPQFLERVNN